MVKVSESIKKITPYKPGKPISEVERELGLKETVKLASNENPLGPSPKVVEAVKNAVLEANFYPDGNAFSLKNAIIEYHAKMGEKVEFDEIVVGNGSNEVIDIAIRTLVGKDEELLVSKQAFVIYELIPAAAEIKVVLVPQTPDHRIDIDGYIKLINKNTKMVCLVNPNNPTGTYYSKAEFEKLLKAMPEEAVLLVDEAYVDFADAPDYPNTMNYRKFHKNTIIARTFSKAFGMSGIRLGYCITTPEIVDYMNRVREPFNTNNIAQAAGIAALNDMDYLKKSVAVNKSGREYYYSEFKRLGLEYLPTQGNFILVKVGEKPSIGAECYDFLLRSGVIVRPMGGYGFPNWIRISIGLEDHNRICIEKIEKFLGR